MFIKTKIQVVLFVVILTSACGAMIAADHTSHKMDARLAELERLHHTKINTLVKEYHAHIIRLSRLIESKLRGQVDDRALDNIQTTLAELEFQLLSLVQEEEK